MHIRKFRQEDQKSTQDIILEGLKEYWGIIDHTLNPDVYDIQGTYIKDRTTFVVVEKDGVIVGTGGLQKTDDKETAQMVRVSVRKDFRRKGIAREIIAHLLLQAKDMGYKSVLVETTKTWVAPRALYNKLGFNEIREDEEDVYMLLSL